MVHLFSDQINQSTGLIRRPLGTVDGGVDKVLPHQLATRVGQEVVEYLMKNEVSSQVSTHEILYPKK